MTTNTTAIGPQLQALSGRQVLDVRRRPAFDADDHMLPGAQWRDPSAVETWAPHLDPTLALLVYCVHGHEVSQTVARRLCTLGFTAHFLEGGIEGWRASGLPLDPRTP